MSIPAKIRGGLADFFASFGWLQLAGEQPAEFVLAGQHLVRDLFERLVAHLGARQRPGWPGATTQPGSSPDMAIVPSPSASRPTSA